MGQLLPKNSEVYQHDTHFHWDNFWDNFFTNFEKLSHIYGVTVLLFILLFLIILKQYKKVYKSSKWDKRDKRDNFYGMRFSNAL